MTLNYFQMFHDATREHAESLGAPRHRSTREVVETAIALSKERDTKWEREPMGPMRQAILADEARHMRAPMYHGDPLQWIIIECACGVSIEIARRDINDAARWCADWRIERCDGSSCGIENCGRMIAKCGRCRS